MTLTVRPQGQLLAMADDRVVVDVTAVVWTDRAAGTDAQTPAWGGTIEPQGDPEALRRRLAAGENHYRLRLQDGREGVVLLSPSEFEADGAYPLTFMGLGQLAR